MTTPEPCEPCSSLTASMVTTESATDCATWANCPTGCATALVVSSVTFDVVKASTTSAVLRPTQPPSMPINSAVMPRSASAR